MSDAQRYLMNPELGFGPSEDYADAAPSNIVLTVSGIAVGPFVAGHERSLFVQELPDGYVVVGVGSGDDVRPIRISRADAAELGAALAGLNP